MDMKRILYLSMIIALLLTPALAQDKTPALAPPEPRELVGEYIYSSGFVGAEFKITGDGEYEYRTFSDCCDPVWAELGTYSLEDNLLHFRINKKTLNNYDLLDPKQALEALQKLYDHKGADLPAKVTRTQYDMQIVKWGGRIYLIDPDRMNLFVAAVNFGVEPRQQIINETYLTTRFFLRRGDEHKAIAGKPELSEPWISYLQDSPIKAAVTNIEMQNQERIYTVSKGSADGVKVGMCFVGEGTKPEHDNLLLVISVEERSAKLKSPAIFRATDYQPGNTLVTKAIKGQR